MRSGKKIYLIGMPGSGKSFLGELLAKELSLPFIDLDQVIVTTIGISIADYFTAYGESAFRTVEQQELRKTITDHNDFVLATGGGTPCFFENLKEMRDSGMTIFINTEKAVLLERNLASAERPLMRGDIEKKIASLLKNRLPIYQKAHLIVSEPNPQDLALEINQFFKS